MPKSRRVQRLLKEGREPRGAWSVEVLVGSELIGILGTVLFGVYAALEDSSLWLASLACLLLTVLVWVFLKTLE